MFIFTPNRSVKVELKFLVIMARISIRRLFIFLMMTVAMLIITCFYTLYGHSTVSEKPGAAKPRGQKPIFRFQLEQELERLIGRKLTPANGNNNNNNNNNNNYDSN